jgi:hypothetical protein
MNPNPAKRSDWNRHVAVRSGYSFGLYDGECCSAGTCTRPPDHTGPHDQFDGGKSPDAVPFHAIWTPEVGYPHCAGCGALLPEPFHGESWRTRSGERLDWCSPECLDRTVTLARHGARK